MPSMPPARKPVPARPASPAPPQPAEAEIHEDDSPDESFLSFGEKAETQVKTSMEANAFRGVREFFITKKETAAAKARNEMGVTVRVHFAFNYADKNVNVSVPRCTIKEGGEFRSYTSAGDDCALAAGGANVSVRPVYIVIDHRVFVRKDQTKVTDEGKLWIPSPTMLGTMTNAIKNLAENLGVEASTLDIRKYEARITKTGEGRQTTWAIDFVIQPKPWSKTATEWLAATFKDGYKKTLSKWLAPNPKYMISKGGKYTKPARNIEGAPGTGDASTDEPPY